MCVTFLQPPAGFLAPLQNTAPTRHSPVQRFNKQQAGAIRTNLLKTILPGLMETNLCPCPMNPLLTTGHSNHPFLQETWVSSDFLEAMVSWFPLPSLYYSQFILLVHPLL